MNEKIKPIRETGRGRKYKYNYGDQISDNLIYIEEDTSRKVKNHRYIIVQCKCGERLSIRTEKFKSHISCRKCGVLTRRKTFEERHIQSLQNALYKKYIVQAEKRNYTFELSFNDFLNLINQPCYYCGEVLVNSTTQNYRSLSYNGIDRKINSIGYVLENVVPCCKICNTMKNKWDEDVFLKKIKQIYIRKIN